jgi:hypothetical protein
MIAAFQRKKHAQPVASVPPTGIPCSSRGCTDDNAQPCAYRDRRGRTCRTSSCRSHGVMVAGTQYCRRHAGTMQALGVTAGRAVTIPDVNDRAPSLVNWMARDLDASLRTLLANAAGDGESIVADEHVQLVRDHTREARWERGWRLVDHTGLVLKVTLFVNDDDDSVVNIRLGEVIIASGTPPWIANRSQDAVHDTTIDVAQRHAFYRSIETLVADALKDPSFYRRATLPPR